MHSGVGLFFFITLVLTKYLLCAGHWGDQWGEMTVRQMMPWDECTGENDQGAVAERADVDAGKIVKTLRKSISGRGRAIVSRRGRVQGHKKITNWAGGGVWLVLI